MNEEISLNSIGTVVTEPKEPKKKRSKKKKVTDDRDRCRNIFLSVSE